MLFNVVIKLVVLHGHIMKTNKYYIYAHRRTSDNQIFYIGKGCANRAYSKLRSKLWHKYVKKHEYYVEFLYTNLTEQEAFDIEKKLINKYGRLIDKTGCLINLTDGGEGLSNYIIPQSTKNKISISNGKKVYAYYYGIIVGEFHSAKEAERQTGISASAIIQACLQNIFAGYYNTETKCFSKVKSHRRLKWTRNVKNIDTNYSEIVISKPRCDGINVNAIINDEIIISYPSVLAASKDSGVEQKSITRCCTNKCAYAGVFDIIEKKFVKFSATEVRLNRLPPNCIKVKWKYCNQK